MRHNLASCLALFLPTCLFVSVAAAAALLLLRSLNVPTTLLWFAFVCAMVLAAVASWLISRRGFLDSSYALAHLDEVCRMHNRLTAADAGIGEWPVPRTVRRSTRWNWQRLFGPVALSMFLLTGAAWLPIPHAEQRELVREQPLAWTQVESWLQTLEEARLVEPEAIEKLREQLQEIRNQSPDDWYRQSSLEAGDTLRDQTEHELKAMLQHLEKAEETVAAAQKSGEKSAPGQLKELNDVFQKSLQGLEMGNLPLNKEMVSDLKKFDATKLKQVTAAQLAEMRSKMQAGKRVAEQCVRPGANLKNSLVGENPGDGGPGGGGSPAPLALKKEATNLRTKETDSVSNEDSSQALPGEVVGVERGAHDINTDPVAPQMVAGGSIMSAGEGGEAVRHESFTPEEREVLQRFFK